MRTALRGLRVTPPYVLGAILGLTVACRPDEPLSPHAPPLPPPRAALVGSNAVAVVPGVNGRIVFNSDRTGNRDVFAMNADGTGLTNLTNNPAHDAAPVWSPDGTRILFHSNRSGNFEIHAMNADGTGVQNLTQNGGDDTAPSWSPDGSQVAFISTRDGNQEVYVMRADGTSVRRLTNAPARDFGPRWSPDGTRIAFWSERDGNYEIYVMNADGSNVTRLTNSPADDYDPSWSPDGARIAFWSGTGNAHDVYVMNANGTNVVNLTRGAGDNAEPAWSPDGTKLVFVSNRLGGYGLCTMNADGSGTSCLPGSSEGGPDWGMPTPPATPGRLAAVSPVAGTVILTWRDNASTETHFEVVRTDPFALRGDSVRTRISADATTASFTGLATGISYHWDLRACQDAVCSPWHGEVGKTPNGADRAPAPPTNLVAKSPARGVVVLTWTDNASNETEFQITKFGALTRTVDANVTTVTIDSLDPGTSYHWDLRACNTPALCSAYHGVVGKTPDGSDGPPAAPTNLVATSPLPGVVVLTWTDNAANETEFQVTAFGALVKTVGANVTTVRIDSLNPGTSYHWDVRACNVPPNCSAYHGVVGKTPDGSDAVPAAPSNLVAKSPVVGTVVLTWQDNSSNETRFEIWANGSLTGSVGPNITTSTISGLNPGVSYNWAVRACNAAGCSPFSAGVGKTPDGSDAVPARPNNLAAVSPSAGTVILTWRDNASNETRFEVTRDGITLAPIAANATTVTYAGLNPGVSYHWDVRACNGINNCSAYNGVVGKTPDGSDVAPAPPSNLVVKSPTRGTVVLTWRDNSSNETYFEVTRGGLALARLPANATTVTYSGLDPGFSYHWDIRACNTPALCSPYHGVVGKTPDGSDAPPSVMTFSPLAATGTGYTFYRGPYTEAGFTVSADIGFCFAQTPASGPSDFYAGSTGSSNCYANGVNTLTKVGGGTFSFLSIDLAPFAASYGGGAAVTFVGRRADNSTVSVTFRAPATLAFSRYYFSGLGFDNLTSVTWTHVAPYHQFDNITAR